MDVKGAVVVVLRYSYNKEYKLYMRKQNAK